jgi:superfamily II DNA or RNA helicase
MEHASPVYPVSPAEDLFGRFKYKGYKPRLGQEKLIQHVSDNPSQQTYNGALPTGYGKTHGAICCYEIVRMQMRCNRLLILVPTDTQREQYVTSFQEGCDLMGIRISECRKLDGEISHLRAHKENRAEVFVTTVQAILANETYFAELMKTGRWMIFCDEYHKLRAEAAWGGAIRKLSCDVMLGLTATPVRTDREATVFGHTPPDVVVTFEEAYRERAIRGVVGHIEHYFVDVQEPDGTVRRLTTEELGDERNFESYQKARGLRLIGKYLAGILSAAHDCLVVKNLKHQDQHQMLVFCMSVAHAKTVSTMLNAVYGPGFADWIGVGPDGRSDAENKDVLDRYVKNKLLCLVQVDKAGEGFDNPRSSVLVFLNLLRKATVKAHQQGGRGLRRNYKIRRFTEDVCDMFASPDTEMADLILDFVNLTVALDLVPDDDDADDAGNPRDRADPFFEIPPFAPVVQDAEFDRSEIISRALLGIAQEAVDENRTRLERKGMTVATDDDIRRVMAEWEAEKLIEAAQAVQKDPETQRARVNKAVSTLAGNVIRMVHGSSFDKTIVGDCIKLINGRWKKVSDLSHSEMFEEEFVKKYEWVQKLNHEIRESGEVPSWLRL